jgi:Skp family chaperone for outer membrane proteins
MNGDLLQVLLLLISLALSLSTVASAEDLPEPKIAVVNVETLFKESLASKSIDLQLKERQATFQKEVSPREDALRTERQELLKQRSVLSAEVFNDRRIEFEKEMAELERDVRDRQKQLLDARAVAMGKLEQKIREVASDVANEKGANIVLTSNMVIYSISAIDITSEVLSRLNKQLPTIEIAATGE